MGDQSTNLTPDSIENSTNITLSSTGEASSTGPTETVPLATYLEMKSQAKKLKGELADLKDSQYSEEQREKKNAIYTKWKEKGFDDDTATAISEEISGIYDELGKTRKSKADELITEQIADLSQDDYYSGIKKYEAQIKAKIKQFKKAGEEISVEDAYLFIVGPRAKTRESTLKNEVIESVSKPAQSKPNVGTASSAPKGNSYNLDSNDRKALKQLQQMQPGLEWTEEKYFNSVIKDRR